ncbi:MAG TPA: diguanylate cyclase [Casimicrobiaceae bacterium]|nr:diguanylate cyclase [Casimicrobiaceae bacterium]
MDRIEFSRVARILAPYFALWLVVAAALVGFSSYEVDRRHQASRQSGRNEAQNLSMVMSQHMAQVIAATDRTLTMAKLFRERKLANVSMAELARAMAPIQGTDAERRINVFDRNGVFVGSTDPEISVPGLSIADRSYFVTAKVNDSMPLYIGEAVMGRLSKVLIIPVAKRLVTQSGDFDGVVVTALDPQRLVTLFRELRVGENSSVGIAHRDGPVLAWARAGTGGSAPLAPASFGEVVLAEQVVMLTEVPGTELIAFASLSESDFLAEHRRFVIWTLAFTITTLAAITLPIVWVGARAWREVHGRRQLELRYESAYQQARTDSLTGLANRTGFDEARREAHERLKGGERMPFAIAFIDVDHFKRLNDSMGHDIGDEALCRIAETLSGCVRQSDVVGRLGGDEFAVLMPGVTGATMHRRFDPIKLDLDAMAERCAWPISFSIGVVACETPTPRARDAVNFADRVMYDAKGAGRDTIRYAVYRDGALIAEPPEVASVV